MAGSIAALSPFADVIFAHVITARAQVFVFLISLIFLQQTDAVAGDNMLALMSDIFWLRFAS